MSNPTAVIISDIHYDLATLEVADVAMNLAIAKSSELGVDLIITGDLHNTKANLRGECVARMLKTFSRLGGDCYILRGNHDQINEKSEEHSLEFLRYVAGVLIVDKPTIQPIGYFIPYQHDPEQFKKILVSISEGSTIFCHQGVIGSTAGHYIQDKSAVPLEWLKDYRVISGHYHTRQTLGGQFDYVGNPYTLGFGEANDPEKGFQVLYDDGSLEFVPTNLRKHRILEFNYDGFCLIRRHELDLTLIKQTDILWIKIHGATDQLCKITKENVGKMCRITQDFKLDLIPLDTSPAQQLDHKPGLSQIEILDSLIDNLQNTDPIRKQRIKGLWKNFT